MSVAAINAKPLLEVRGSQMHFPVTEGIDIVLVADPQPGAAPLPCEARSAGL
jgi:hypothetical protein